MPPGGGSRLAPVNYSLEDGLRSAQCSPSYPAGGGGSRTFDGRLWFTTTRGIAVFDPKAHQQPPLAPAMQFVEITSDGDPLDPGFAARLEPGAGRVQFRYTAIHLSAPERVQYSYRLEGLDPDWVRAGGRRVINYNSLAARAVSFHRPRGAAGRTDGRASLRLRGAPVLLRADMVPRCSRRSWCSRGHGRCTGSGCGASAQRFSAVLQERAPGHCGCGWWRCMSLAAARARAAGEKEEATGDIHSGWRGDMRVGSGGCGGVVVVAVVGVGAGEGGGGVCGGAGRRGR